MGNSNLLKLLSNYGSKLWGMISIFIFIPIYIRFLGIENYAIIGFYSLLLGIISFADAGMSSAIIKEFASENSTIYKYSILRRLENLYIFICTSLIVIVYFFSDVIAERWLSSEEISVDKLSNYVILIGIGTSLQLLSSLYFGALFGLNEQIRANSYQIIWNLFKSGFVIFLFIFYKPVIEVFLVWQIFANFLYIVVLRNKSVDVLNDAGEVLINILPGIPSHILKYIGGMSLIAIISSINSQADKIISSSFFTLKVFGYYNMGSVIAQIPVIVASPLVLFVFPMFSKFAELKYMGDLVTCFRKISFLLSILVFPATILLVLYTYEIMNLWIGNSIDESILSSLIMVIKFLVVGSLFLALQFPLFYLLLSRGQTKYTIYQGVVQIILGLPLLYLCAKYFGLKGIGIPWVVVNFGALSYLSIVVFRNYLYIDFFRFFKESILVPGIISTVICFIFYFVYCLAGGLFYLYFCFSGLISILVNISYHNYKEKQPIFNISNLYSFQV